MDKLKIQIENILKEITDNVFLEEAFDSDEFPYIVYSVGSGTHKEGQMLYFLDVDVWDKNETTENIDALAYKLKKLDKTYYIDKDIQFTLYFDRIINSKSEDKTLKRYTIIFEIRAIERS